MHGFGSDTRSVRTGARVWGRTGKGVGVNLFTDQRGSVASELSFGVMVVGILVLGGLFAVAQIEGVSFTVLVHQLRGGH